MKKILAGLVLSGLLLGGVAEANNKDPIIEEALRNLVSQDYEYPVAYTETYYSSTPCKTAMLEMRAQNLTHYSAILRNVPTSSGLVVASAAVYYDPGSLVGGSCVFRAAPQGSILAEIHNINREAVYRSFFKTYYPVDASFSNDPMCAAALEEMDVEGLDHVKKIWQGSYYSGDMKPGQLYPKTEVWFSRSTGTCKAKVLFSDG